MNSQRNTSALLWVESRFSRTHLDWAMMIAGELRKRGIRPVVASSSFREDIPDWIETVKLPGWMSEHGPRKHLTCNGILPDVDYHWQRQRRQLLLSAYERYQPIMIFTESWPYAKGAIYDNELLPLLQAAKGLPIYSLLLDIPIFTSREIAAPAGGSVDSLYLILHQFFAATISTGDGRFVPYNASPSKVPVYFPGYFFTPEEMWHHQPGNEILVAGGAGFRDEDAVFYRQLLVAIPTSFYRESPWRFVVSPDCPADIFAELLQTADALPRVTITRNLPRGEFESKLANCRLAIVRSSYVVTMKALAAQMPMLIVPRPSSREQIERAQLAKRYGVATVLQDDEFAANLHNTLQQQINAPPQQIGLGVDGAARAVDFVMSMQAEMA